MQQETDPSASPDTLIERWRNMLAELRGVREPEYAMFSVALRELLDLAQSTIHTSVEADETATG